MDHLPDTYKLTYRCNRMVSDASCMTTELNMM